MTEVVVPEGYSLGERVAEAVVMVSAAGDVCLDGVLIGHIEKGHRTYSPPTHKGSRIVRYHKQVPEWHGYAPGRAAHRPSSRRDTRREVLRDLIREATST